MNGGPNGFLNKRQPSMSLMNLHHALTMENPAETRRQHLARLRRNIMVRRSLRTLPHNMVPSAKTRTTFPNTIRSRIIFATAPKCSRRKRSENEHSDLASGQDRKSNQYRDPSDWKQHVDKDTKHAKHFGQCVAASQLLHSHRNSSDYP